MTGKQLKNSILQWAIQGKLVPQDPNDEPASVLLEKIRAEKARLIKEGKIKKDKKESIIYRDEDNSYYEKIADGKVICIDDELPYNLPLGWTWCRLNELGTYRKGPFGSSLTKSMFVPKSEHSIKVYEQKNAIQKDYRLGDYYISEDKFLEMQSFVTRPSDIIVSCAGTIGETYLLPEEAPIGIINQALMRVGLYNLEIADYWQLFFAYILLIENEMKGAGSAIKNIPPFEYLKAILVPIPPLQEQKRITERYNELSGYIDRYEQLREKSDILNNSLYTSIKKSILQEAIQGKLVPQDPNDEPASVLLERIQQEKNRLLAEGKLKKKDVVNTVIFRGDDNKYFEKKGKDSICIDEEIPFDIPDTWSWTRLSNVAEIYTGNSISETEKKAKYTNVVGRYYIGTKDVGFDNKVSYNNGVAIPKKHEQDFRIAPKDSILMCIEGGSAGRKIAIINQDVCFGNKLCCFSPFVEIGRYIYYYLQSPSFIDMFNGNKTGIIGGVSIAKVKEILIPLPPQQELERIVAKIDEFVASIMSR